MRHALAIGFGTVVLLPFALCADGERNKLPDNLKALLDKTPQFELYSLEPSEQADAEKTLHGWKILGKTTVKDAETRKKLLTALQKSIAEPGKGGAKCFEPRHALRVPHEGKDFDVVICFACGWVYVYLDGKEVAQIEMDRGAQPLFDEVLGKAGVPVARKQK